MIQVYERQSNRVPGITSLYLSFDFNQSIIDTIKNNCEAYDFNKKTKEWELPIKNCSNILDLLSFLDDILINILPNKENAINVELNMNYKTPPKEYQIDAIKLYCEELKLDCSKTLFVDFTRFLQQKIKLRCKNNSTSGILQHGTHETGSADFGKGAML